MLGPEVRSTLGKCSIPDLYPPPYPAQSCREAVFMQCFPCDACHEVLGCCLGTEKKGNIGLNAKKIWPGELQQPVCHNTRKLEENEDFILLTMRFQLWFSLTVRFWEHEY